MLAASRRNLFPFVEPRQAQSHAMDQ